MRGDAPDAPGGEGFAPAHPIGDRHYGLRDFTLADPCGFEIRFAQPLA